MRRFSALVLILAAACSANAAAESGIEITSFVVTPNPVPKGLAVTIAGKIKVSNVDPSSLSATVDFGDGTVENIATDVLDALRGLVIWHSYSANGVYLVTLSISGGGASAHTSVYVNVGNDGAVNPADGMSAIANIDAIGTATLQLGIGRVAGATTATTSFDDATLGRNVTIDGLNPSLIFTIPGISIATSTALDANGAPKGKVRKTLAVSARNVGDSGALEDPPFNDILLTKLTGKFSFTQAVPDNVRFIGQIALPKGFNPTDVKSVYIAVGNIADKVTIDAKGKAAPTARIPKAQIKYLKFSGPTAVGGEFAKLSVTLSMTDMIGKGFDTEGITGTLREDEVKMKSVSRNIQMAVVLGGVAYTDIAPVNYKVSSKSSTGQISLRPNIPGSGGGRPGR